jgi:hypothetical protein
VLMSVDVAAGSVAAVTPTRPAPPGPGADGGTGREVDERRCACGGVDGSGCTESMEGSRPNALYASSACRTRAWKRRTGYRDPRRRKASPNARVQRKPSLRISYRRAVAAVAPYVGGEQRAEAVLRPLLSEAARRHA